jgi:DinB family protein
MSEPDDSHDLAALRARLAAARERLANLPLPDHLATGPVDPSTGESWHGGNVLGHMSEMLGYWHHQIQRAREGSGTVGRDAEGAQLRRRGIDGGEPDREPDLMSGVDLGIVHFQELLETWSPDDLERTVTFHNRDGERKARLGELLQMLVVAHVEEHLAQLASLG